MPDTTDPTDPLPPDVAALADTLGHLHAELESEKRYRHLAQEWQAETERQVAVSNRWAHRAALLGALNVVLLVIGAIMFASILRGVRASQHQIASCVDPPARPHPAGTPLNRLTCYERSQQQTSAAVNQIIVGFDTDIRQRLLEVLDAARTGKPVTFGPLPTTPPPTTTTTATAPR